MNMMGMAGAGGGGAGIVTGQPVEGAGIQTPQLDNGGSNSAAQQPQGSTPANNSGQEPDLGAFWQGNQQQQPGATQPPQQQGEQNQLGQQIAQQLSALKFDPIMTPEALQKLNNGDVSGVNEVFQTQLQAAVQQSLAMNVQILKAFQGQMVQLIDSKLNGTLTARDTASFLESQMPSAKDPRTAPMVNAIFQQAMVNSNGDRQKALELTQAMWKTVASVSGQETGLMQPPNNGRDGGSNSPLVTVESLMGLIR